MAMAARRRLVAAALSQGVRSAPSNGIRQGRGGKHCTSVGTSEVEILPYVSGSLDGVFHRQTHGMQTVFSVTSNQSTCHQQQVPARLRNMSHGSLQIQQRETIYSRGPASDGPLAAYRQLLEDGVLQAGDVKQEEAVEKLQELHDEFANDSARPPWMTFLKPLRSLFGENHWDWRMMGIYMYGGVGTGKTMLMDVFFNGVPVSKKKRIHFHSFMLDMHTRLHRLRNSYAVRLRNKDPIAIVAEQICEESPLLCLDELEVTDIADALILLRLFSHGWPRGLVLVATSNNAPEGLYRGGLNRQLFVPFYNLLRDYCDVINLDGGKDYRRGCVLLNTFLYSENNEAQELMDKAFEALTDEPPHPTSLPVMMGRKVVVPLAAGSVARFNFDDICGGPLGAADYLVLAQEYRVIFVDRIPWLGDPASENLARRFITLIDIMYENLRILFCSSAVPIDSLFSSDGGMEEKPPTEVLQDDDGHDNDDERTSQLSVAGHGGSSGRSTTMIRGMEWSATGRSGVSLAQLSGASFTRAASRRTVSRLLEMQSEVYLLKDEALGGRVISLLKQNLPA